MKKNEVADPGRGKLYVLDAMSRQLDKALGVKPRVEFLIFSIHEARQE
jgi:hypothetical protein